MKHPTYLLAILVIILGCQASEPSEDPGLDRVRVHAPEPITLTPGETVEGAVRLEIKQGYHVQANPVPLPYLIPTELEWDEAALFTVGDPVYPKGEPYSLLGSPDTLVVYDGMVPIAYSLSATESLAPGEYTMKGTVIYQACDDRMCFPPVREPLVVSLRVQ